MEYIKQQINSTIKYLPNIRPLTEFIHLNLYFGLQDKFFWQALEDISLKYSIIPFPEMAYYQGMFKQGFIDKDILNSQIKRINTFKIEELDFYNNLFRSTVKVHLPEKTYRPINKYINEKINYSLKELTEPILIRFLSGYIDQGISEWKMPLKSESMLSCFIDLNLKSYIPIYPMNKRLINKIKDFTPNQIIHLLLSELFQDERMKKEYIEELLLSLKGWSAYISNICKSPELIRNYKKLSLEEYIAIRLIIERSWIDRLCSDLDELKLNEFNINTLDKTPVLMKEDWLSYKVWHESFEKTFHFKKILKIKSNLKEAKSKDLKNIKYVYQAVFCIDDRECILRRNLECFNENVQTFGTPGHFGLDISFKETESSYAQKHCPAPLTPKHLLQAKSKSKKKSILNLWFKDKTKDSFFIFDLIDSFTKGVLFGLKLFSKVFNKKNYVLEYRSEDHITDFDVIKIDNGIPGTGFSEESAAEKLSVVLASIGLVKNFSDLVYIIGHESTTINNPYFNAYGCGACSGRSGHINSIAFVRMANNMNIRKILFDKYKIDIPVSTYFISGVHNTTKETVFFFEESSLPDQFMGKHKEFVDSFNKVLIRNSEERSDDFELIKKYKNKKNYLTDLSLRSYSIFEPRPELGHTKNALCVVASRDLTRGLSLERRAFLQSYDWSIDPDGEILNSILSAAVPVCGGINLDYFFSRMNTDSMGAGSKLSHNIVGLTGLSHGTEDDILPGLAQQMVELHHPIRMLFVIEQKLEIIKFVINKNESIRQWVTNEWVRLACICPITLESFYFENGDFYKLSDSSELTKVN